MYNINIITDSKGNYKDIDLYTEILNKLIENLEEKNWSNVLNRKFIKRIIMTVPYGSTHYGQVDMLEEEFKKQYSLKYLIEYNSLPLILDNNIIQNDDTLILNLQELQKKVEMKEKYTFKYIEDLENSLLKNLRRYMFNKVSNILTKVTRELYPNIMSFIDNLRSLKLTHIETDYCIYPIIYYKEIEEKIVIKKGTYTKSYIDYTKLDIRKSKTSLIANICQGMGDSFILQKFIESSNIKIYPIHDALLCSVNEIDNVKLEILKTYKYVYNYYLNYKDFQGININREEYNIDSLNIYDV
jgi:hypothetical protein